MKSLMKLREGHEQRVWALGTGSGAREMGMGRGRGLSFPQQPSPNHPTDGGGSWGDGAINTSRIPERQRRKKGAGPGISERGQGQARAAFVRGARLLGWPWRPRRVPWLAAVLAEVAVALDVGAHQVAHLHWVDLPTFAVADLGGKGQPQSPPAPRGRGPPSGPGRLHLSPDATRTGLGGLEEILSPSHLPD